MTSKSAVALVREAVADLNKVEIKAASLTRSLAASCMVFYSENGGDKPARTRLAVMLLDLTTEGVEKQVMAWVGKNLAKYEPNLKAAIPEGAEAARDAVLAQFEDRPWREIRSEHTVKKTDNGVKPPIKAVPADGPLKKVDAPASEAEVAKVEPIDAVLALVGELEPEELGPIVDALNALIAQKLDAREAAKVTTPKAA